MKYAIEPPCNVDLLFVNKILPNSCKLVQLQLPTNSTELWKIKWKGMYINRREGEVRVRVRVRNVRHISALRRVGTLRRNVSSRALSRKPSLLWQSSGGPVALRMSKNAQCGWCFTHFGCWLSAVMPVVKDSASTVGVVASSLSNAQ